MPTRAALSGALLEAGLEAEAARRWAWAIEQEQAAATRQRIDPKKKRSDIGPFLLTGLFVLNFAGMSMMLGYVAGRLLAG